MPLDMSNMMSLSVLFCDLRKSRQKLILAQQPAGSPWVFSKNFRVFFTQKLEQFPVLVNPFENATLFLLDKPLYILILFIDEHDYPRHPSNKNIQQKRMRWTVFTRQISQVSIAVALGGSVRKANPRDGHH